MTQETWFQLLAQPQDSVWPAEPLRARAKTQGRFLKWTWKFLLQKLVGRITKSFTSETKVATELSVPEMSCRTEIWQAQVGAISSRKLIPPIVRLHLNMTPCKVVCLSLWLMGWNLYMAQVVLLQQHPIDHKWCRNWPKPFQFLV